MLCRCEEISRAEILAACRDGARHLHIMKTWTRAGMGHCQGRMCHMSVTACIAKETGKHPRSLVYNKPRVPTRPIPINEILAALDG
ncbi:MAG: (2Fe-2S)-binding protein [Parvibaculaceae bacterium]